MKKVVDILIWLDRFAPRELAEDWDNVGLLWGDSTELIRSVMTCLTVTDATAAEAIERGAGMIVSHHPVLFKAVRQVTVRGGNPHNFLWPLARAGIAIASPHTALDNCRGGINDLLAERLGLVEVGPLRPSRPTPEFKVVVFTPEADRARVLDAAFAAGAGRIGDYRECSFGTPGTGTFFGEEGANPTVGQAGRREEAPEWRLELICPQRALNRVSKAIRQAHSYEEPAVDVYPLHPVTPDRATMSIDPQGDNIVHIVHEKPEALGVGRLGRLPAPERLADLAARVARLLDAPGLQYVGDPDRMVERIAIACGAGDDFVADARSLLAHVLLTGEARYHRAIEAEAFGIGLILAGHHATERPGVEMLARRLAETFPDLEVWASARERDPVRGL
jgi:dinuclear metal center YbgI/SA1388 family protein